MLSNKLRKNPKIGHPIRVLIVEDSGDDTELMIRYLSKGGFYPKFKRVQSANGLKTALSEKKWDIILCDHNMPGFDSISALRIVNERHPELPFILVSDSISESTRTEITNSGGKAVITKINLHKLVPAVVREIKKAQQLRRTKEGFQPGKPENVFPETKKSVQKNSSCAAPTSDNSKERAQQLEVETELRSLNNGNNGHKNGKKASLTNILIVEDELIQSILLEKLLKSLGYTVIGKATTGADAIDKALTLQPDLITMDISLQDNIDGIMATTSIQEKRMIPVIYISGNSDKYNFERAEKTNFVDFIPKPVSKERLANSINKAKTIELYNT